MNLSAVLSSIPSALREPLLSEYKSIISNYVEKKWRPAELSGGLFCEIVYSILDGFGKGAYPLKPSKPSDFVGACRALEQHTNSPRSFRILIPRLLPPIYEVRNNRNVGHVGGDVDPNEMDAILVVQTSTWIMAEFIRVFHQLTLKEAQAVVNLLIERKTPIVWEIDDVKRVLVPDLTRAEQILILLAVSNKSVSLDDLQKWVEETNLPYLKKILSSLHSNRKIEWNRSSNVITLLPPGATDAENLIQKH